MNIVTLLLLLLFLFYMTIYQHFKGIRYLTKNIIHVVLVPYKSGPTMYLCLANRKTLFYYNYYKRISLEIYENTRTFEKFLNLLIYFFFFWFGVLQTFLNCLKANGKGILKTVTALLQPKDFRARAKKF